MPALSATDVINLLALKPHPEGGYFRESFRDQRAVAGARAASTAIYFLLTRGELPHPPDGELTAEHAAQAVVFYRLHCQLPCILPISLQVLYQGTSRQPVYRL